MDERVAAAAYAAGWSAVSRLPEAMGRRAFTRAADHAWRNRLGGVRQLEANLRRVTGPDASLAAQRALSKAAMRSYFRYFYEAFRLPSMGAHEILGRTRNEGIETLENTVASGRGVVAALPHMGNWDHAGAWITLRGTPLTTVAERLRPEELYQRFTAFRTGLGMEVLALDGGAHTVAALARRLREGGLVCLLADRDLAGSGFEVGFFGETARMAAGPAVLAERTGAALMPVTLWFEGERWRIRVHPEIPPPPLADRAARARAMTQELARVFEGAIAEHPEDWHMLQPVFTADLAAATRKASGANGAAGEDEGQGTGGVFASAHGPARTRAAASASAPAPGPAARPAGDSVDDRGGGG